MRRKGIYAAALVLMLALGGCALAGMAVYFVLALVLGLDEARLSVRWVKQLVKRG